MSSEIKSVHFKDPKVKKDAASIDQTAKKIENLSKDVPKSKSFKAAAKADTQALVADSQMKQADSAATKLSKKWNKDNMKKPSTKILKLVKL